MIIIFLNILLISMQFSYSYKPVMLIPGIGPSEQYWFTAVLIKLVHPGTDVVIATYDHGIHSFDNIWNQVHGAYYHQPVQDFLAQHPDGFHIIAGSQGTAIARALIEYYGVPVIDFFSISGVHMGIFQFPITAKNILKYIHSDWVLELMDKYLYKLCNTEYGQKLLGICGFERDPCHYGEYLKHNEFLAYINNEIEHENSTRFKENFLRIRKLYLFTSPDDNTIYPWQSGYFGSLTCNGSLIEMKDQRVYKEDLFGLKTLDLRGAVNSTVISNIKHMTSANFPYMYQYIIPHLT